MVEFEVTLNNKEWLTMKKFIAIALVALLAFSVFAQGAKEAESKTDEVVTIEWWNWDTSMSEQYKSIIAEFEAKNPNIKINMTLIATDGGEYKTKLSILAQQGAMPDTFTISSGDLEQWAEEGLLRDITDLVEADKTIFDDFSKAMFDASKAIAKTEGYVSIPFAYVSTDLFYNKDMFDAAGLEYPNENWTWDDFLAAAKALTLDTNGDGEIDQWGFYGAGRYAQAQSWVVSNNGKLVNEETKTFDPDAKALEALQFVVDLVKEYKVAPQPKDMSSMRWQDIFPNQVCAMFVDGGWLSNDFRNNIGDKFQWGVTRVPMGPSATERQTYGWPDSYAMSPDTKHPEEAWTWLKYLAGEGITLDQFMAGKMPAYKALVESEAFVDLSKQPGADMQLFRDHTSDKFVTTYTKGWSEWVGYGAAETMGLAGGIDACLNGEYTFDEAIAKIKTNTDKVLSRYY